MLDVSITKGEYWGGSQISYSTYMILAVLPFTGLLGIDHLALRSPLTAVLKILSIIPLFGFWYFYDIAQATGEDKLIKQYGIGVPFYGPVGIGHGIFKPDNGEKYPVESPPTIPRPWIFMAYAITTLFLVGFPLNKFIIGDYEAGLFYFILFITIFFAFIPIIQGLYDIFNLLFNTKSVLEEGVARIPGVAWWFKPKYTGNLMGPKAGCDLNGTPEGGCEPTRAMQAATTAVELGTTGVRAEFKAVQALGGTAAAVGNTAAAAGAAAAVANKLVDNVAQRLKDPTVANRVADGIIGLNPQGATPLSLAGAPTVTSLQTLAKPLAPPLASPLASPLAKVKQAGGALQGLDLASITPSIPVLLFSVGLLSFTGYVFYMYKNTYRNPEKSDDPPRNTRTVREPFKTGE